jgi:hypothetical protein
MNTDNASEVRVTPVTPLGTLVAMFSEPSRAFAAVEQRSMMWFPLLLSIIGTAVLMLWYFQIVDFAWLQDRLTANLPASAERDQAMKIVTKDFFQVSSVIKAIVGIPLLYCVMAGYFSMTGKLKNLDLPFGKWFAFICWSSVPTLLLIPLGMMQILLTNNGQLELSQLNSVSLNQIFFHIETGRPWASLLSSLSITSMWSALLMVIGFQVWSKLPRMTSAIIVLIPYGVFYGIWMMINLYSKAV